MSLFSSLQTSVSGMSAQSSALSAISDNIANSSTTGYKRASTDFETLLGNQATSSYESGGVLTDIRYGITDQGSLQTTTSNTDLAINGNGFFVVSKDGQGSYLTRAGSFLPDQNGVLTNTAGYQLMGYKVATDGTISSTLSAVTVAKTDLQAAASLTGKLTANLPSTATAVAAANLPSTNSAGATYTNKTSITAYDDLGQAVTMDVYLTKTADNAWEVAAYNQGGATNGGFPYAAGSQLGTASLTFDPTTGKIAAGTNATLSVAIPNGNTIKVDMSNMTQLATSFAVGTAQADGNAPSQLDHISVGKDGTVTEVFASGAQTSVYKIPLASVNGPDQLAPLSGNVYEQSVGSGTMVLSTPGTAGTGSIISDSLEQSTVDLATELTNMITAQRSYEANSKVLQASSDLLSVLNRLTTN